MPNQTPKIIVLPSDIYTNWLLMEDARAGSDTIIVQYDANFYNMLRNVNFVLSSWDGTNAEIVQINSIISGLTDMSRNRMGLDIYMSDLTKNHTRHSVLVNRNSVLGFTKTKTSCTY